ncbi:HlyU family transcriptional regulator [Shimia sp. SDUM112013]|uniref:HlyU family transcriptional regulator n=1 Tax=Shimia sp. SDUM112013 TaxID=3136160 RepID=UPI0032EE414B
MSFLKKLFGSSSDEKGEAPKAPPIEHNGFMIYPQPIKEGTTYRVSARIEKVVGGELKTQVLVRADTLNDPGEAANMSSTKAQQVIDEQGEKLFDLPQV